MRSAVLQFLLAGALVVAWIWMLGRPLLTMLARRSRRDSVGHFRYQQAALGRTLGVEPPERLTSSVLRPVIDWRAQPLEQRRLQVLLAGAIATFASVLLAIALRGVYVRLFLVMAIGFSAQLLVAAWIGSRELRFHEAEMRRRTIDDATRRAVGRSVAVRTVAAEDEDELDDVEPADDLLTGDGLGGGLFDEGFFEPIPELETRPTRTETVAGRNQGDADVEVGDDVEDQSDGDESTESDAAAETGSPAFTTPPVAKPRPRPGRPAKGRPIYIEPQPGEGDESVRAVND